LEKACEAYQKSQELEEEKGIKAYQQYCK